MTLNYWPSVSVPSKKVVIVKRYRGSRYLEYIRSHVADDTMPLFVTALQMPPDGRGVRTHFE
eukprot:10158846-Karenia_brevis.AAC.1